ncbi:hypothetical protein ACLMJK_006986 [Lecanora helva]
MEQTFQANPYTSTPIDLIAGVRVLSPGYDPTQKHDLHIADGRIKSIDPHDPDQPFEARDKVLDARNYLIASSLCHAHVHLDKCFLLSDPKYADLEIVKGDFAEAMTLTSEAKQRFEREDLLRRGKWLITESILSGVTHMRCFAEVDYVVGLKCLDAAIELKRMFEDACEIQICAFAQEPLFSGPSAAINRTLMNRASDREEVDVLGSTPYVEHGLNDDLINMKLSLKLAFSRRKHLDLHLDYDLERAREPSINHLIGAFSGLQWTHLAPAKTVAVGHCTRLTRFPKGEWERIARALQHLPFHIIGLPTSDLFMQGKPGLQSGGGRRSRGTLQIPQMIDEYGIKSCISINNVGNAFTPCGSCDPLSIASMGVALYQAGTKDDAQILYECVSKRAKAAIGYPTDPFTVGESADFVLFDMEGATGPVYTGRRGRRTLQEIVNDPPHDRKTIFKGQMISV